jgi:hypothetical protein
MQAFYIAWEYEYEYRLGYMVVFFSGLFQGVWATVAWSERDTYINKSRYQVHSSRPCMPIVLCSNNSQRIFSSKEYIVCNKSTFLHLGRVA